MSSINEREAVARGAALLDERVPGWAGRILVERLDLAAGCNCIVGQLFTDAEKAGPNRGTPFTFGVDLLAQAEGIDEGADPHWIAYHGFDTGRVYSEKSIGGGWNWTTYEGLQQAWLAEIEARV